MGARLRMCWYMSRTMCIHCAANSVPLASLLGSSRRDSGGWSLLSDLALIHALTSRPPLWGERTGSALYYLLYSVGVRTRTQCE